MLYEMLVIRYCVLKEEKKIFKGKLKRNKSSPIEILSWNHGSDSEVKTIRQHLF